MHLEAPLGELRGESSFCAAKGTRVVLRAVSEAREDDNRRAARWRLHLHPCLLGQEGLFVGFVGSGLMLQLQLHSHSMLAE